MMIAKTDTTTLRKEVSVQLANRGGCSQRLRNTYQLHALRAETTGFMVAEKMELSLVRFRARD